MKPVQLKVGKFQWPNSVQVVPQEVFGPYVRAIVVPDGFLVPGHANGGVYIITVEMDDFTQARECYTITDNTDGYFYHMGEWIDMNGDGLLDFVTAKSNAKAGGGRLVWYEHPAGQMSKDTPQWTEHLIVNGPDVGITIDRETYKPDLLVYAAQFFDESVNMYRVTTTGGEVVQQRVIDDTTILSAYMPTIVNLNNKMGEMQLLVNNHEKDSKTNGVFTYTRPADPWNDVWEKTTLASGFKNAFNPFVPGMSPGFVYPMWPQASR
jgi:hypothetical protein